jgi:aminopeptidase
MDILNKYAALLVHYCLEIKPGDRLLVQSTHLAEHLLMALYAEALKAGGDVEFDLSFREKSRIYYQNAGKEQLLYAPLLYRTAMEHFDTYLVIRAPFNLREDQSVDPDKRKTHQQALSPYQQQYFSRTADGSLRRSLCQFPTQAAAQEAGMSLSEYEEFVFHACRLFDDDPVSSWLKVREEQQKIVDFLNKKKEIRYVNPKTDIKFSVEGRTWINSDGRANMPSGEVFSSPVEDSVEGVVHFDYPSVYLGHAVQDITLKVKNGRVEEWEAAQGGELLDQIFAIDGARHFGEVAIGTNYNINRPTKNILFDEKIGGTIHMAVGQTYLQTGGKNKSSIHWDMIAGMQAGGQIYADGEMIYENGKFLVG